MSSQSRCRSTARHASQTVDLIPLESKPASNMPNNIYEAINIGLLCSSRSVFVTNCTADEKKFHHLLLLRNKFPQINYLLPINAKFWQWFLLIFP